MKKHKTVKRYIFGTDLQRIAFSSIYVLYLPSKVGGQYF